MNAYVVVEHAGDTDETQVIDFPTRRAAYLFLTEHYDADELEKLHVDVMKRVRMPDGTWTLTTEF